MALAEICWLGSEFLEEAGRQWHEAIDGALAVMDVNDHACTVDVANLEPDEFADAQAAAVGNLEEDSIAKGFGGVEEEANFGGREDAG
jgi:hypothetical protein